MSNNQHSASHQIGSRALMRYWSSFLLMVLFFFSAPSALASDFFDAESGLVFPIPEGFVVQDDSTVIGEKNLQVKTPAGQLVFEVVLSSRSLDALLQDVQLRTINVDRLGNRDLLGITGIELVGTSFTDSQPRRALLFRSGEKSVAVLYHGANLVEFDGFLDRIQQNAGFVDSYSHALANEIAEVAKRKIFSGYKDGERVVFKPEQGINRAEFLKVLVLSQKSQAEIDSFYLPFKAELVIDDKASTKPLLWDVDRNAWFAPYIFYAFDQGWVQGYPDGSFKPGNLINIAEATKIFLEARGRSVEPNAEVWFEPYLRVFAGTNILNQQGSQYRFIFTERLFFPYENCTRAQAAGFLARLIFLDEHPEFSSYGRLVMVEELDFVYESEGDFVILQSEESGLGSQRSFQILKTGSGSSELQATILIYLPEVWTDLERTGQLAAKNVLYLGENKTYIFAAKSVCQSGDECLEDLQQQFQVKRQDLTAFNDPNMSVLFSYSQALQFEKIIDPQLETLILKRDDGSQMLILSHFKRGDHPFLGQTPLSKYLIGNREWNAYVENVKGSPRLSLVADIDAGAMVASIPGLEQVVKVDPKVFRILRSLEVR